MNLDDPKLTAYALDELDPTEREAIARAVGMSPEASDPGFVLQPVKNAYEKAGRDFIGNETPLLGHWQSGIDYGA